MTEYFLICYQIPDFIFAGAVYIPINLLSPYELTLLDNLKQYAKVNRSNAIYKNTPKEILQEWTWFHYKCTHSKDYNDPWLKQIVFKEGRDVFDLHVQCTKDPQHKVAFSLYHY